MIWMYLKPVSAIGGLRPLRSASPCQSRETLLAVWWRSPRPRGSPPEGRPYPAERPFWSWRRPRYNRPAGTWLSGNRFERLPEGDGRTFEEPSWLSAAKFLQHFSRCWSRRREPSSTFCPSGRPARCGPGGPSWPTRSGRKTWFRLGPSHPKSFHSLSPKILVVKHFRLWNFRFQKQKYVQVSAKVSVSGDASSREVKTWQTLQLWRHWEFQLSNLVSITIN